MPPTVSICIPTRNQAQFISDTLDSAFRQDRPVLEVLVVDDASTDHTAAVVEEFRDSLPRDKAAILRYVRNSKPLKIGGNFDRAVRLSRGEFVVKVDSDDILEPNFTSVLLDGLQGYPRAGWAHCNIMRVREDKSPLALAHFRKSTGFFSARELAPTYLRRSDTCHCVMLRRSAYDNAGGYRSEMKTSEDRLLWLSMIMGGHGCYYDSRVLARMRHFENRPLMSNRLLDLVESIQFLLETVECQWDASVEACLGITRQSAIRILRDSWSDSLLRAGIYEPSNEVRAMLYNESRALATGCFKRLCCALWTAIPRNVAATMWHVKGMPRALAKALVVACR